MMERPTLSAILIARENTSILLRRAIESALCQEDAEVTLTIVDANEPGSAHSRGLAEVAACYPSSSVIAPGGARTEASLRNMALAQARGEYVAFLCARDEWAPGKVAAQIAGMAGGKAACCANGLIIGGSASLSAELLFEDASEPARWLAERPMRMGSQMLYRASALRAIGGFDERLSALCDLDAALRLSERGKVAMLPEPLFTARAEQSALPEEYADGRLLLRKYEDALIVDRGLSSEYDALLARQAARMRLWLDAAAYLALSALRAPLRTAFGGGRALVRAGYWAARRAYFEVRARVPRAPRRPAGMGTEPPPASARTYARYPAYRFAGNGKIGSYAVPERATRIARGTFFDCRALRGVRLPRTLERIGAHAFQGCANLEHMEFADGSMLSEIGDYAFAGCASLATLRLPGSIRRIGKGAFLGCANLSCIEFGGDAALPAALAELSADAFADCPRLTELAFADGSMLVRIGRGAFRGCRALRRVKITGAVQSFGARAFQDCVALREFEMPLIDAVREIGPRAFENCASLPEAHIPDGLARIRAGTYLGCAAIARVKIPAGVKRIGRGAFRGCLSLKSATVGNPDAIVARSAFPAGVRSQRLGPDG